MSLVLRVSGADEATWVCRVEEPVTRSLVVSSGGMGPAGSQGPAGPKGDTGATGPAGAVGGSSVAEFPNKAAFPAAGAAQVLYVAKDTNMVFRWDGAKYVQVAGGAVNGGTP